ncbi:hypothetical protein AGMMS49991_09100 [Spirochaetia bacterium]|nr:hypothetical protein AGMMS49991_09100 [Spirochaetia bacterium]
MVDVGRPLQSGAHRFRRGDIHKAYLIGVLRGEGYELFVPVIERPDGEAPAMKFRAQGKAGTAARPGYYVNFAIHENRLAQGSGTIKATSIRKK